MKKLIFAALVLNSSLAYAQVSGPGFVSASNSPLGEVSAPGKMVEPEWPALPGFTPAEEHSSATQGTISLPSQMPPSSDEPITVRIDSQEMFVKGELLKLRAVGTGGVVSYAWSVDSPDQHMVPSDGGRMVQFTSRQAGVYRVFLSVAGFEKGKLKVVQAIKKITLVEDDGSYVVNDVPSSSAQPRSNSRMQQQRSSSATPPPRSHLFEWTSQVKSPNARAEAMALIGALNRVAGGIDSNTITPASDLSNLLPEAKATAQRVMGPGFKAWSTVSAEDEAAGRRAWWDNVFELFANFRKRGAMNSKESYSSAFRNMANVLKEWLADPANGTTMQR